MGASSGLEPTESPEASPLGPWSYGLGATGGYQPSEGSFAPQPEEQPRQYSWVAESLFDNPKFTQAGFHIVWLVTIAVDTEDDHTIIKVLYSDFKSTSAHIDVSTSQLSHFTLVVCI
jgi:hypothetical protein